MESTAEEDLSSMANHSFSGSGDECSAAAEESGWTAYIDYFMETQQQHKEASSTCTSPSTNDTGRSTSELMGDHGAGGAIASFAEASSRLPALVDPSEVSKRLSFRKEGIRRKKLLHDESLEDTATSPISGPKLIDSRDSEDNHEKKEDACDEISHMAKKTADELDCDNNHIINDNGANTNTDMISDYAHDHNELRKQLLEAEKNRASVSSHMYRQTTHEKMQCLVNEGVGSGHPWPWV